MLEASGTVFNYTIVLRFEYSASAASVDTKNVQLVRGLVSILQSWSLVVVLFCKTALNILFAFNTLVIQSS